METLPPGDDLTVLLARQAAPVTGVTRVSKLASPRWPRAAYHVTFADGTVRKARRFESAQVAAWFVTLAGRLPPGPFPRLVEHEGRAVLLEWFDGRTPEPGPESLDVCRQAGAILRAVHAVSVDDLALDQSGARVVRCHPDEAWAGAFETKVEHLCRAGGLDAAEGARLLATAIAHAPAPEPPRLVLGDLAPDNIIVDPQGGLSIVDTDGVDLYARAYDLARVRYRWSMTDAEWRMFEDGYASHDVLAAYRAHLQHWTILVLVGAAAFRLRHGLPDAARPLDRLRLMAR